MTPVTALSSAAEASQLADTRPVASPTPHDREYHPAREQRKGPLRQLLLRPRLPLDAYAVPVETFTFLFTDIEGSTAALASGVTLDP